MAILEKFGTIYLDGVPVPPGTVLTKCDPNNPPKIELGDTVPGMEIGWVFVDNRLIADDNILLNVSWDILSASGLAMGKDIQIDGDACRVRCLQEAENGGSDWEDLLNRAVDDYIIHWSGTYSMGTSVLSPHSKQAIIWGCADKDTVEMADSSYQHIGFGWRPVLEQKSLMELPEQELLFRTVLLFEKMGLSFPAWWLRFLSTISSLRIQASWRISFGSPLEGSTTRNRTMVSSSIWSPSSNCCRARESRYHYHSEVCQVFLTKKRGGEIPLCRMAPPRAGSVPEPISGP